MLNELSSYCFRVGQEYMTETLITLSSLLETSIPRLYLNTARSQF